jgi:hypothetical protein
VIAGDEMLQMGRGVHERNKNILRRCCQVKTNRVRRMGLLFSVLSGRSCRGVVTIGDNVMDGSSLVLSFKKEQLSSSLSAQP